MSSFAKISYCITCKGRLHHLRETLPANILQNTAGNAEFVVLDYSSCDGVGEWIRSNFSEQICSGVISYFRCEGYQAYCSSHAKNVAHRLATGEILCNLDADNFAGNGFSEYLRNVFNSSDRVFVRGPVEFKDVCGRIAFRRSDFFALGGYDERMISGWGYDDWDIAARAELSGLRAVFIPEHSGFLDSIKHSDEERTMFNPRLSKWESNERHRSLSMAAIAEGRFVANSGVHWGGARLVKNFREIVRT